MKLNKTKLGDVRWKRKFALFPKTIRTPYISSERVWLEWVWVQEEYRHDRTKWGGIGWVEMYVQTIKPLNK